MSELISYISPFYWVVVKACFSDESNKSDVYFTLVP